ncbi:class I ribonucleotide reductase maintenance protein YfaE [Buchnera aphidicola]|uniref:class I ribonucleotide reductase maintenance protein YfaE n=1 Tax=Buchnera aphidicola TaxID=9 RepID=UPI0034640CC9
MLNSHIILINKNKKIFVKKRKIFLLKILLANDIKTEYQCKKGYCGICRIFLKKGKILYKNFIPLAFLKPGEILPCCCIIDTNIEIKI